ncbi:MAG: hypothetical protein GY906_10235 [bacterium]|nr:hypothetical protein [bacterium]
MTEKRMPRYPVYIPTKGRADYCLSARMFAEDGVPFQLVIEEAEYDAYAEQFGEDRLLVLPFSDQGSVIPARNWIKQHATAEGHKRHWQFDDNIRSCRRLYANKRLYCRSGVALAVCEDFTDRYTTSPFPVSSTQCSSRLKQRSSDRLCSTATSTRAA